MPALKKGSFNQDTGFTKQYTFSDVVINGEQLPVTFKHQLQGGESKYQYSLEPDSPDQVISFSAKATTISRTETDIKSLSGAGFDFLQPGRELTPAELTMFSNKYGKRYTKGVVLGGGYNKTVQLIYEKTADELKKEWMHSDPVGYSQHSSIVMSKDAPAKAMAFDLAVGICRAFDYENGEFWVKLLRRGDWRMKKNGLQKTVDYYDTGILNKADTKDYMNKPDDILPKGKFGVVNEFYHSTTVKPAKYNEIYNTEISNLQWDMPESLNV